MVDLARDKAGDITDEHELVLFARERAKEIETEAHRQAEEILAETDEYIIDQLSDLEAQLMKTLTTVRNGLRHVQETRTDHDDFAPKIAEEALEQEEEFEE
jgi:hypothetical protein